MSYRAFKRLLGDETSLERKCRFLFGAFILVLITGSFLIYARQTEHLAYDQIATASRLLATQEVDRHIDSTCRPPKNDEEHKDGAPARSPDKPPDGTAGKPDVEHKEVAAARKEFRAKWEEQLAAGVERLPVQHHPPQLDQARRQLRPGASQRVSE